MARRLIAISFIYVCTVVGWMVLAGTMWNRTETQDEKLQDSVRQLWGEFAVAVVADCLCGNYVGDESEGVYDAGEE